MLHAATIAGAYGIKGWVKLRSFTDPMENVLGFSSWYLKTRGPVGRDGATGRAYRPIEVAEGRRQGKGLIARFAGIADRDAAEQLRGQELWVPADELPALEAGDFYWHQLEGLEVWTVHEGHEVRLGAVVRMLETGANDVMVVASTGTHAAARERLIPYVLGSVVQNVDVTAGRIDVVWHPED